MRWSVCSLTHIYKFSHKSQKDTLEGIILGILSDKTIKDYFYASPMMIKKITQTAD